jgi:hypothetical protein
VTDYVLFTGDAPPAVSVVDDGSQYTLGMEWGVTAPDLYLKGYRFHRPADLAITGPIVAGTWDVATTNPLPDAEATFVLAGSGWQDVLLDAPVPIAQGVAYRSGAHFPNGRYAATANYWSSGPGGAGVSDGPLVGYSQPVATENEQGSLAVGAVLAFPSQGAPNATNYWVTPIVTDEVGDVREGAVSLAFTGAITSQGVKAAAGLASPVLTLGGGATDGDKAAASGLGLAVGVSMAVTGSVSMPTSAPVSEVLCSSWATPADVPASVKTDLGLTLDSQWTGPLIRASELLWMLSGRRWYGGGCQELAVLRSDSAAWPWHESWGRCGCWTSSTLWPPATLPGSGHVTQPLAVRLPRDRVTSVVSVTVDGVLLDPSAYRVSAAGWLERTDGGQWAVCSATTEVLYRHGSPPPRGGVDAAVTLAIELAKDFYGLKGCKLPRRVTAITRQGVSLDLADPGQFLERGHVGLMSVDLWLSAVNPGGHPTEGLVWSPDLPQTGMRTL